MTDMPLTVEEMLEIIGDDYGTPNDARGQCWRVADELVESFGCFEWIGADHANDPIGRFEKYQQHSNHFAAYHEDSDTVVDFTFRQFDEEAPYPLMCSKQEWFERLAYVWDTDCIRTLVGYMSLDYDEEHLSVEAYDDYLESIEFIEFGPAEDAA